MEYIILPLILSFTSGEGNALNKLLLEDQEQYNQRYYRQKGAGHHQRKICAILSLEGRKACCKGHIFHISVDN